MSALRLGLTLTLVLAFLGCRSRGETAQAVTRRGVRALQLGMSADAIVQTLGRPLNEATLSDDAGPRKILTYASPTVWHAGDKYLWTGQGARFVVTLRDVKLDSVHIADTALGPDSGVCVCTQASCPVGWAEACLHLFPE